MIRYTARQLALRLALDLLSIWLALALASLLRAAIPFGAPIAASMRATPVALYVIAPVVWIIGLSLAQIYNRGRNLTLQQEIFNLALGQLGAVLVFFGVLYITYREYSRLEAIYLIVLSFSLLAGHRLAYDRLYRRRVRTRDARRVVIVGTDEIAQRLADVFRTRRPTHLELLGFVRQSDDPPPDGLNDWPVLGGIDDLPDLVRQYGINELVVSVKWFDQAASEMIADLLRRVEPFVINVRIAPDYSDITYFHTSVETLYGIPLIGIREQVLTPYERLMKRLIDVLISSVALVVCLPLFGLIALAIRLDSPGPVLLFQERAGFHGRPFRMLKFRSMYYDVAAAAQPPYNLVKVRDDPRITRVGRWLRRTSLDELPQFVNVLRGDMSLVGPRPEIPSMVERYEWWQRKRFEVPQGMTGWWQINGRADRPMHYFTGDDLFYIRNYSIWLDLWIIARTVFAVIFGRGAY